MMYPKATISQIKQLRVFVLLIILLAITSYAHALTYYVDATAGNPITFGAYSSGAKPVISGADIVGGKRLRSSG
jgi:hypothetical protein